MSTATTNQRAARIADQLLELIEVSKLNRVIAYLQNVNYQSYSM